MKKLFLIFISMFSFVYGAVDCSIFTDKDERAECERMNIRESMSLSQATRQNEKRRFIGFEGGYGHLDLEDDVAMFASRRVLNMIFGNIYNNIEPASMNNGYMVSVSFGWQRYHSNRVGSQLSRGFRYARSHKIGESGGTNPEKFKGGYINTLVLFIAYDKLFDFVRKGDKHFGLRIGGELDLGGSNITGTNYYIAENNGGYLSYIAFDVSKPKNTYSEERVKYIKEIIEKENTDRRTIAEYLILSDPKLTMANIKEVETALYRRNVQRLIENSYYQLPDDTWSIYTNTGENK